MVDAILILLGFLLVVFCVAIVIAVFVVGFAMWLIVVALTFLYHGLKILVETVWPVLILFAGAIILTKVLQ